MSAVASEAKPMALVRLATKAPGSTRSSVTRAASRGSRPPARSR